MLRRTLISTRTSDGHTVSRAGLIRIRAISVLLVVCMAAGLCGFKCRSRAYKIERADFTNSSEQNIVVEMFVPEPDISTGITLVMCHGLTGCRENFRDFAERLAAEGIVVCLFDFRGGGNETESDGSPLLMTVYTEIDDLTGVMDSVAQKSYVDPGKIYLFGHSQGGLVASLYAAQNPGKVAGMVLLAPAYNIPDVLREYFPNEYLILPVFPVEGMILGYNYGHSIYNMDVFEEIQGYNGPVLILHGTADPIVDPSYSVTGIGYYRNSKLILMEGCDHILSGDEAKEQAYSYLLRFLRIPRVHHNFSGTIENGK